MKRIKLIVLFFFLLLLFDFTVGTVMNKTYFNIKTGDLGRTNAILKDTSKIIILGSSRATHHYNPLVFEEALGATSYNGGLDHSTIFYHYAILAERLKRSKPKILILDIHSSICDSVKGSSGLCTYLPYTNSFNAFKEIVKFDPSYSYLREIIQSSKFNSIIHSVVADHFSSQSLETSVLGFLPLKKKMFLESQTPVNFSPKELNVDAIQWEYLEKIVSICKKNDIDIFLVISPLYYGYFPSNAKRKLRQLGKEEQIDFFDFSSNPFYVKNNSLFTDALHMNAEGAKIFSSELASLMEKSSVVQN